MSRTRRSDAKVRAHLRTACAWLRRSSGRSGAAAMIARHGHLSIGPRPRSRRGRWCRPRSREGRGRGRTRARMSARWGTATSSLACMSTTEASSPTPATASRTSAAGRFASDRRSVARATLRPRLGEGRPDIRRRRPAHGRPPIRRRARVPDTGRRQAAPYTARLAGPDAGLISVERTIGQGETVADGWIQLPDGRLRGISRTARAASITTGGARAPRDTGTRRVTTAAEPLPGADCGPCRLTCRCSAA